MSTVIFIPWFRTLNMGCHQVFCGVTVYQFSFGSICNETKYRSHLQGSTFEDENNNRYDIYKLSTELVMFRDP